MRIAGRLMLIKIGDGGSPEQFTTVACQRGGSNSQSTESIEVSSKESRWRQLIGGGVSGLSITASGLIANAASQRLLANLAAQDAVRSFQIIFADGQTLTGPFKVESWGAQGEYNAAQQYELTLQGADIPDEYSRPQYRLLKEGGDAMLLTEGGALGGVLIKELGS